MTDIRFICNNEKGLWYLGATNSSDNSISFSQSTAIENPEFLNSTLVIPELIEGHQIDVIGSHAFYEIEKLEIIHVNCKAKMIMDYAFGHLYNLKEIYLPTSIETMQVGAITGYNFSIQSHDEGKIRTSKGTLIVLFPPTSQLRELQTWSITRKERILIYFWGSVSPKGNDPFYSAMSGKIIIHSPYLSMFCGHVTIHNLTFKRKQRSIRIFLFLFPLFN